MAILKLTYETSQDVDMLCEQLLLLGCVRVLRDHFEHLLDVARKGGLPWDSPPVQCIMFHKARAGKILDIEVILSDSEVMTGKVSRTKMSLVMVGLSADTMMADANIKAVVDCLRRTTLRVEVESE